MPLSHEVSYASLKLRVNFQSRIIPAQNRTLRGGLTKPVHDESTSITSRHDESQYRLKHTKSLCEDSNLE